MQQSEDLQVVMEELIPQGDLLEEQWYVVNRLLVKETITGELSGEDWAILENLAIQCYDTHGPSVFIAQSMLPACRWQEYHELSLLACETAAIQIPSVAIEESISYPPSMSLYPNPTSNLVRVDINELEPSAVPGELILKNAYGKIVLRQSIHENIIDLQQLPSGMYILEWWSGNHRISTEKLIKS
ncbi:MAG: T9SS type A sorting domain-containing protein [Lewinella sp.]|uniref:T9SS type A sorting domain-containing protein n=1 Tax=Lewinella sp. TaxID=2004506 RepID=UPI003D6BCC52